MIIDTQQSNIETIGDIQEFKTGIDPKNLEYITTLLSSNLYSEPEKSFIRETVSNAWDSHIEAGTTDMPILVELKDGNVSIRDFGVGLSPDRFKEIWCNIGSSTKRESNDFIGGFGIGRFSALACSDAVYITSYYEGTAYHYIMVKENNAITTNLVASLPTTEKNGVEVTIKGVLSGNESINKYRSAITYINFFPNVYINDTYSGIYTASQYNENKKISHFKNFAYINHRVDDRLLLGNVLYPLKTNILSNNAKNILLKLDYSGIVLRFSIGEISITPNRENIIYTAETIRKIEDRITAAYDEMMDTMKQNLNKNYTDCSEYYKIISSYYIEYDFISNTISNKRSSGLLLSKNEFSKLNMLNNVHLSDIELSAFINVMNTQVPYLKAVCYDGRFYNSTSKLPYQVHECSRMRNSCKPILIKNGNRLTAVMKNYIREYNIGDVALVTDVNKLSVESLVSKCIGLGHVRPEAKTAIIDSVWEHLKKCDVIDFNTDKDFLEYKAEISAQSKELKASLKVKEFLLHCYDPEYSWIYKVTRKYTTLDDAKRFIKQLNKGVVISTVGETTDEMIKMAKERGYYYITCNKEVSKVLRELNLSCVISPEFLYKDDPQLAKVYTIYKYRRFELSDLVRLKKIIPDINTEEVSMLEDLIYKYNERPCFRGFADSAAKEDVYIKYLCNKYNNYCKIINEAEASLNINGKNVGIENLLLKEYIRKNKLFRMDQKVYKDLNNSNIIRLVCRK